MGGEIVVMIKVQAELRDGVRAKPVGDLTLNGFAQPEAAFLLVAAPSRA